MDLGIINDTFLLFGILLIAAMATLMSEKVGVVNIAVNGFMIFGALIFKIMGATMRGDHHQWTIVVSLLFAGLGGALISLLFTFITVKLRADHIIAGTAINLLLAGLAVYLNSALAPLFEVNNSQAQFQAIYIDKLAAGSNFFTQTNIIYMVVGLVISANVFAFFKYTKQGLRAKSIGENPFASDAAAVKVIKYKWLVLTAAGFLSGLAGGMVVNKIHTFTGNVQGLGFLALAIMIMGQWKVYIIIPSALLFAFLTSGASRWILGSVPKDVLKMIPFITSLVALVFLSKFNNAPAAVGKHFVGSKA